MSTLERRSMEIYERQSLVEEIASWIDTDTIAETIVEAMEDVAEPEEMTLENAKKVWLSFLEAELNDGLKRTVRAQLWE